MDSTIEITTSRLRLIGAGVASLRAQLINDHALGIALGVAVPAEWPPEHIDPPTIEWALAQIEVLPTAAIWRMYFIALPSTAERPAAVVIGTCGFKGPPDAQGGVEIGYSLLSGYQSKGFATEATAALIEAAYRNGATRVIAETLPHLTASRRVMEKCGMIFVGAGSEEGVIRYSHTQSQSIQSPAVAVSRNDPP